MSFEVHENITMGLVPAPSSPSLADSTPSGTNSSLSFTWGPGALAGIFLTWLGDSTLNAMVLVVIRRKLFVIKQAVRERPHIFRDPGTPAESREVGRIYVNLRDLCRKNCYPVAIRRKAARLVLEIAFLVHLKRFNTVAELSHSLLSMRANREDPWDRWSTLLRLSNLSALSRDGYILPRARVSRGISTDWSTGVASVAATLPQAIRSRSTDYYTGVASTGAATTVTTTYHTATSGATPSASGFFSEARTSVTSLGNRSRQTILKIGVRRKLSRIKRTIRRQPHIFLGSQGVEQMQEVDYIYNELQDLSRFHASPKTRRRAARLILEISVIISGPSDIILLNDTGSNYDDASRMWIELVTQGCVHSLLTVGPSASPAV